MGAQTGAGAVVTDHRPPQRVRHQAREALAVMAFSAAASVGLTTTLVLLSGLAR